MLRAVDVCGLDEHLPGLSGVLMELDNLKGVWLIALLGVGTLPHHLSYPHLVRSLDWRKQSHVTQSFDLHAWQILVHYVW